MSEVSLEPILTEKWESALEQAETTILEARYNLGRIGLIYNGQLHLEWDDGTL